MKPTARALTVTAAVLAVTGCTVDSSGTTEAPRVVVTTGILGDIVGEIVGTAATVDVLMPAGSDPHAFALSTRQAERLTDADLVVANGLGLEANLRHQLAAADEAGVTVLRVAVHLDPLGYDGSDAPDPHVWTDPARMQRAVDLIADTVITTVPQIDTATIRAQAQHYHDQLAAMETSMTERLAIIPDADRQLVTNHHVFAYFAERFNFRILGAVIPSATTLTSPSASDLDELADIIRETGTPAIFADSSQPSRLADALADDAGLDIEVVELFTESLGPPGSGADTYLGMLETNTDRIAAALT